MKQEIINCLTWYANKVAETTQYKSWTDEFCRKEIKESTGTFLNELKKHIDWSSLTNDVCKELRFGKWASDEDVDEEIEYAKNNFKGDETELEKEIQKLENTKGIRLIPLYLLPIVPVGTELISIGGEIIIYNGKNVDNDIRCGCIAYGIKPKGESK